MHPGIEPGIEPGTEPATESDPEAGPELGRRASNSVKLAVQQAGRVAGASVRPSAVALARFGYVMRGLVYTLIGVLAAETALGLSGGEITDSGGAILAIYSQPFGQYLLAALTSGLLCYAGWNILYAILDLDHSGFGPQAVFARLNALITGGSYVLLAVETFSLLLGAALAPHSSDAFAHDWTATFLNLPYGVWIVVTTGAVLVGVAVIQLITAVTASFQSRLKLDRTPRILVWLVHTIGRLGYGSFGAVIGTASVFLIVAALRHNPNDAKGLGGSLAELALQPYGQFILFAVAIGLCANGLFSIAEARYRRIA